MSFKKLLIKTSLFSMLPFLLMTGVAQEPVVSFENQIKPIFEKHCISCHGLEKEEGTRLDIRDDALDYIESGDAENSALYEHLISDDEEELMPPPEENDPLSAEQIMLVETWINEGASWPEGMTLVNASLQESSDAPVDDAGADEVKEAAAADETVYRAIGSLHPAAIHLPIGLLLAAGLFALFSIRGNFVMSDCAYYCLWLGTIGAIAACVSGWWFCGLENRDTVGEFNDLLNQEHDVFWHRTSALICTAFAILLCLFAASARARDPDDGIMWKLGLMILAAGIAFTGHEGGELTHGKDLYKDLNKLIESVIPADTFGGGEEAGELPVDATKEEDSNDVVGETSAETQ